jgi:uncharacterized membrane protein YciS (DUF1049 family)
MLESVIALACTLLSFSLQCVAIHGGNLLVYAFPAVLMVYISCALMSLARESTPWQRVLLPLARLAIILGALIWQRAIIFVEGIYLVGEGHFSLGSVVALYLLASTMVIAAAFYARLHMRLIVTLHRE